MKGLDWKEVTTKSSKKSRWLRKDVHLKGLELSATPRLADRTKQEKRVIAEGNEIQEVVIIYLQGQSSVFDLFNSGSIFNFIRPS